MEPTVKWNGQIIPIAIAQCCRQWPIPWPPVVYPGGRCGICGEHPTFIRLLPEDEWLHVR